MFNPFGMNSARQGFGQQGSNQPYDFKGLESRLGKIETGIAGLTDQFKNFQMPGQETVDPEYTGNTAPDPLTTAAPTGGISSLPAAEEQTPAPVAPQGPQQPTSMADWVRNYEFDMAPQISASEWDEWEGKQPQWQEQQGWRGHQQGRQNFIENWQENNPEYQRWKEREAGRDPLSQETQNVMSMGMNPFGGQGVIPSVRSGESYEDYMSMVDEAQDAWGKPEQGSPFVGRPLGLAAYQQLGFKNDMQQPNNQMQEMQRSQGGGAPGDLLQRRAYIPPGHPDYNPLTEEQYGSQTDLWKNRQQFDALTGAAQEHLGGSGFGNASLYRGLGLSGTGMGRAYEAWNQFNQSQPGGPYTAEAPQYGQQLQQQLQQPFTNTRGQNNALSTALGAGIGALSGPTQQKIQGYMT
jgi:hypothetical protein